MKKDAVAAAAAAAASGSARGQARGGGSARDGQEERKKGRESARERGRVLEIRLLHRAAGWEKPKALVTFLYVNLGRCTFRPGIHGGGPK